MRVRRKGGPFFTPFLLSEAALARNNQPKSRWFGTHFNVTPAGFRRRGNPSRNPDPRPCSPASPAQHRAVGSHLSLGSPEAATVYAAALTRLAKHRGGGDGIPRLIL